MIQSWDSFSLPSRKRNGRILVCSLNFGTRFHSSRIGCRALLCLRLYLGIHPGGSSCLSTLTSHDASLRLATFISNLSIFGFQRPHRSRTDRIHHPLASAWERRFTCMQWRARINGLLPFCMRPLEFLVYIFYFRNYLPYARSKSKDNDLVRHAQLNLVLEDVWIFRCVSGAQGSGPGYYMSNGRKGDSTLKKSIGSIYFLDLQTWNFFILRPPVFFGMLSSPPG